MIYQNFSKRQLLTLTWWNKPQFMDCDGIICDGSIRSGKTVSMTDGFILWSMSRFNNQNFAICGKTIESLRRNVITLMPQWLEGIFSITERRSENKLIITSGGVTNSYYTITSNPSCPKAAVLTPASVIPSRATPAPYSSPTPARTP